jgi:putative endopeptidase
MKRILYTFLLSVTVVYAENNSQSAQLDFDNNISPKDNFFGHVNNQWIKNNPIPQTEASWGAFNILEEDSKNSLKLIAEKSLTLPSPSKGNSMQLIKDFYSSGMLQEKYTKPEANKFVKSYFDEFEKVFTNEDPSAAGHRFLAKLMLQDIKCPFGFYISQDAKNSSKYIAYLVQDGLGLPDKDYYLRTDEMSLKILQSYKSYISSLYMLYSNDKVLSDRVADNVLKYEIQLAKESMSLVDQRDPNKTYNKVAYPQLKSIPIINWDVLFEGLNLPKDSVIVAQPDYFMGYAKSFLDFSDPTIIQDYTKFHIINSLAKFLSPEYQKTRFDFYGKTLYGMPEMDPQWKLVVSSMDNLLRDAVGQEYVKMKFTPTAKAKALALVENLRKAYAVRIKNLKWMSDSTKLKALEKLNKIDVKIGYPDKWIDYSKVDVKDQPYVLNVLALKEFESKRQIAQLGKPVDRKEWLMGPQTVNAYYNPLMNEIVFPAAILQPPFFDENTDDATNYGGIGMVIGHEFTHGFDDEGRQFDANGNLNNWWLPSDEVKFKNLTQHFVEQYNSIEPIKGVHINGDLTLGENIADLGGLVIAYDAMKLAVPSENLINGYTASERFFINLAKIWREHTREDALRNQLLTDPHSPVEYRVNIPLSNFQKFYETYNVTSKNKMFIEEKNRLHLW